MPWIIASLVLLALAALFLFLLMPERTDKKRFAAFWGVNHAHRGLHTPDGSIPENSLAAFDAAKRAGYGIELDVQLSSDGQVVVFHDDELERVCGVPGRVDSYTYDELRSLRLDGTDQHIPLFSEVLELVDGAVPLIVELKMGPQNDRLCREVHEILAAYTGSYCVESFDPRIVRWFKKNAPQVLRGQLSAPPEVLESGLSGCIVAWGLSHFLGRPHFIAYQTAKMPWPILIARKFAFRVVWTLTPKYDIESWQRKSDAAIFEHYTPPTHFK